MPSCRGRRDAAGRRVSTIRNRDDHSKPRKPDLATALRQLFVRLGGSASDTPLGTFEGGSSSNEASASDPPASSSDASPPNASSGGGSGCGVSIDPGPQAPSCLPVGSGTTDCGPSGESCCTSPEVAGGSFFRTYANDGGAVTEQADPASVSCFRLDKGLVTVGRFRQFVKAWNGGYLPAQGSGKHAHLNGGLGLVNGAHPGTYEPGWMVADDRKIAPTDANLACEWQYQTWTNAPVGHETLPINCVNSWEAYAFCIWDGGVLPSEAEWGYATAGGSMQREYPRGSADPGRGNQYAIYGCNYDPAGCTGVAVVAPVGTATLGAGFWSQLDLVGEVWEWELDWYASGYVAPCTDCANLTASSLRMYRGGLFNYSASDLLPPDPSIESPPARASTIGFRCARAP